MNMWVVISVAMIKLLSISMLVRYYSVLRDFGPYEIIFTNMFLYDRCHCNSVKVF
jgi:hypothetical protein